MITDGRINSLDTHLEQFKLNNRANQNELQGILKEYSQLLDDYKTLKKVVEQKGLQNGVMSEQVEKPRNPYVLVLVDGNGYVFNDELIKEKEEGGMRAARMLNDAVEKYLRESLPEARDSRIIVRIYADLTNLSKLLAKSKLTGLEKRSLAPFTAGFTRAINLFDFTDALDEEGTKFKIREAFKISGEDSACSHILYAACHDTSYLPQLVPFSGLRNKITLVQGAGFNPEFHQFSLNVTQFPTIFRWSDLPSAAQSTKTSTVNSADRIGSPFKNKMSKQSTQNHSTLRSEGQWEHNDTYGTHTTFGADEIPGASNGLVENDTPDDKQNSGHIPCKYFQKGFCRYGNKCSFQHASGGLAISQQSPNGIPTNRSDVSSCLPSTTVPGFIPLNKDSQRIDTYIKPPTQDEWQIYNARFRRQKPCNSFHLQRVCTTFGCPYDHTALEPEARHVLEYVLKCNSCPRKGTCRIADCIYGHLCQKDDCVGQMKGCRMKTDMHNVDPNLASMVPAEDEIGHDVSETPSDTIAMW